VFEVRTPTPTYIMQCSTELSSREQNIPTLLKSQINLYILTI